MSATLTSTALAIREALADVHRVSVIAGPEAGGPEVAVGERFVVGTSPHADLRVSDGAVSSLHLELRTVDEGLLMRDLGSKNGSWIGGCRVREAVLGPGTRVQLGHTLLLASVDRQLVRRPHWTGPDHFGALIGGSPAMRRAFTRLSVAAESGAPVLLVGETGTGKELAARAIHEHSGRAEGPFVVVDPGTLNATLASSELFGHIAGAFTGATRDREGAFVAASGGTLFLDELGDLEPAVQLKLLRAVERQVITPVGASQPQRVDVRLISASHPDILDKIAARTFREDLYYRLAVVTVELPALRDRVGDLPRLVSHLAPAGADLRLPLEALEAREGYLWPGNVRELRSFVRRVLLLGADPAPVVEAEPSAGPQVDHDAAWHEARDRWLRHFEREYLATLMHACEANITQAARRSGLSRSRLYELLRKHGLS